MYAVGKNTAGFWSVYDLIYRPPRIVENFHARFYAMRAKAALTALVNMDARVAEGKTPVAKRHGKRNEMR